MPDTRHSLQDLLFLMKTLRHPEHGCAWDIKQTYQDIAPYTLEETYEVIAAIERVDISGLKEELGDLLFQIVFYAQIAKEDAQFDFEDVITAIVKKMLFRHPHVFPDGTLASAGQGEGNTLADIGLTWDELKRREIALEEQNKEDKDVLKKGVGSQKLDTDIFDHIPVSLPAVKCAEEIQKKVSAYGFDWPNANDCFDKLKEEVHELEEELQVNRDKASNTVRIEEELGDVMFSLINLARKLDLNAELTLRKANLKFMRRYNQLMQLMQQDGYDLHGFAHAETQEDLALLESYWQKVKSNESVPK